MKRLMILGLLTSSIFASTQSDVAITWGHNAFNDDTTLYGSAAYTGVRAGFYTDQNVGIQIGYEQTNSANCEGLKLKRYYTNAIIQTEIQRGLKPYLVGTLGYETSSKEYRDSQPFIGVGAGLKYALANNVNLFIESRALRNLTTEDVTFSTTAGVGYIFDTGSSMDTAAIEKPREMIVKKSPKIRLRPVVEEFSEPMRRVERKRVVPSYEERRVKRYTEAPRISTSTKHGYYVQVEAVTTSSPQPTLRKLRARGVTKAGLKERGGYTYVVVGPYFDRASALDAQRRLKSIAPHAFIKRF